MVGGSVLSAISANFRFLSESVANLGIGRGLKFWRIMLACRRNPEKLVAWEAECRSQSERLRNEDPVLSEHLSEWADHLKRTISRISQVCAWEAIRLEDSDPEESRNLDALAARLRGTTSPAA
jgi:hypothetical protein